MFICYEEGRFFHISGKKNWLAVCNCCSLPSVSSEICLFLVQKISTSMEVYSSRRIEDAKFSDFFIGCWYALIWYSSIQHSFGRFVLDFGCSRNIQIFFLRGGVNPLWQLKLKASGAALWSAFFHSILFRNFLMHCIMSWMAKIWFSLLQISWYIKHYKQKGH